MTDHDPTSEALMLAYVYGELSEGAARAFEAQMANDPDLRAEVEGLLATRELLDEDMRFGDLHGLDDPPPHLRDAIFRAEALARPPELRDAAVMRGSPSAEPPPLLQRLSTWLLGGGVALGAAAALLVVISQGTLKSEAPPAELAAEPSAMAGASAEGSDAPRDAKARARERTAKVSKSAKDEVYSLEKPVPAGKADDDRTGKREATYLPSKVADGADEDVPATAQAPHQGVASPPAKSSGRRDLDPPATIEAYESLNAPAAEPKLVKPMGRLDDAEGSAAPSAGKKVQSRRPSPPAPARGTQGPPALPEDLAVAARDLAELKRKKGGERKSSSRLEEEREKLSQLQNEQVIGDALAAGNRELAHDRPGAALEAYGRARAADPRRTFGILPELGEMKAWLDLGQPARALEVFASVKSRIKLNEQGIEAYRLAARAAERSGRLDEAIDYWEVLAKVKTERKDALAAKVRLQRARAEAKQRAKAAADEEAPAQAVTE